MAVTNYRRGRDFEYRVKKILEAKGYYVMRSAGSKSPVDLACMKDGKAVFVQCKLHGTISPSDWNELYDLCKKVGAMPVLASNERGGVAFYVLTGKRSPYMRNKPMEVFNE